MASEETKKRPSENHSTEVTGERMLILHNDDVHSFDYVVDALIEICNHHFEQAAQCTLITHHKGSCDIYKGKNNELKKMRNALVDRNLKATISAQP